MQRLNPLWQLVNAASSVKGIAQNTKTYVFMVPDPVTFYLRTEHAEVEIVRWSRALIEMRMHLQAPFGWRIAAEQDAAGIYVAAARRTVVGSLSSARFTVHLPYETHVMLNLQAGALLLSDVNGTLEIPPQQVSDTFLLLPAEAESNKK